MLRHRADVSAFAGVPLFERYDEHALVPLARHTDRLAVTPGVTLAHEGRRSHEVLVILSGDAVVTCDGVEVGRLGAGAVIGAREELAGAAHDTTIVAGTGVAALAITGAAFRWAAQSLPDLVAEPDAAR